MLVFNEKNKRREDEDFFNIIYEKYYINVYRKVKNILYSEIDDDITSCVQETFEKAWINAEFLKKHKNAAGWLVKTAENTAYNFNAKYLTRQKFSDDSADTESISLEEDFTQRIVEEAEFDEFLKSGIIEKFFNRLSERDRIFYDLKFRQKLSNEEIGEMLEISSHSVAVKGRRLIEKFKKEFLSEKK
jgi:RNA polymerase sigma factor (sigma-70 family)